MKDLNKDVAAKLDAAIQALKPIAAKLKLEHPNVVAMSIPKTLNDALSTLACLMNHEMSQAAGVKELMLDTVSLSILLFSPFVFDHTIIDAWCELQI